MIRLKAGEKRQISCVFLPCHEPFLKTGANLGLNFGNNKVIYSLFS